MGSPRQPKGAAPPDRVKVTIYMSPDERRALRVEAAERGMTQSDVVREALCSRAQMLPRSDGRTP